VKPLVIGCGALARELVSLTRRAGLPAMDLTCLPATLHNRPERIPAAVQGKIRAARARGVERIVVAYADCGTGGQLDRVLEAEGVERLDGAHCYEIYGGRAAFARLQDEEPGTFYLTDFLARNGERLVWRGLGLDRHPELLPLYFGNYRRVVYLAQTDDAALTQAGRRLARKLGLAFERRFTGLGELAPAITSFGTGLAPSASSDALSVAAAGVLDESLHRTQENAAMRPVSADGEPADATPTQAETPLRSPRRPNLRRTQARSEVLRDVHEHAYPAPAVVAA
jgi:uncharacterized protein DUF1638